MNFINEIVEKNFKEEQIILLNELSINSFHDENKRTNRYYELLTSKQKYFIKIKQKLKNEIEYYNILKDILPVPHYYHYGILQNKMEYIIEEFVDGINLYKFNINDPLYKTLFFSAGEAFGKVFNLKRNITNFNDNFVLSKLTKSELKIFHKYYDDYYLHDGLILFDVAYLCSTNNHIELIKISDFENCSYDDVRPYIFTYKKALGDYFVFGFNSSSNVKYDKLEIFDTAEFFNAQLIKEKAYKNNL